MNKTLEIPPALSTRIRRGATPRGWVEQEDPGTILQRELGDWFKELSESEGLFKKHVYANDEINDSDIRQHRCRLAELIAAGETLALNFLIVAEATKTKKEVMPIVEAIDQKVKDLYSRLFEYHGPIESQPDVPESFKQASREVNAGKLEEMDI